MKAVIAVVAVALAMLCSPAAKAWNCPSGQIRQQAPVGTPTSTPYYDVVEGIAFICVPATPPSTPSTSTNNSTSNSSANANSNSQSNSNSTSGSLSNSTSKATGGNASATGGNATATGGQGGQGGQGGSVSNSGNSSNTNTNTNIAQGGQGGSANQKQGQNQSQSQGISNSGNSSASANGNGSNSGNNSNNNTTNVPRQTPPTVVPPVFATASCFKGLSAGGASPAFSFGFSGGKIDENCRALNTANSFMVAGSRVAYCKVMLTTKDAKIGGVTMDDCMNAGTVQVEQGPAQPVVDTTPIVINIPPPVILQAPPPVVTVIPAPVTPPAPSVAQVAAVHKAERQHAVKHAPCVTNQ